ncbi:MAG: HAD-IA family hydrolase [Oscillospiraceae bacterium]|nr:HAD-IA family hydrolase [Oscillospiraceae bacterium]MDY2847401.1 HAD-IA family hydrolase [Oscillospiraceae bacterium]
MKYKAVIFDLDGTLLDTLDDLKNSVNYALEACGYPLRTKDEVRGFVGNGIRKLMIRSVPGGENDPKLEEAFSAFKEHYAKHCRVETRPYEGIMPMLEKMQSMGLKTAIVSNKADFAVKELAADFFEGIVSAAIGEREGVSRKPSPDSVFAALSEIGEKAEDSVYVGDSEVDIMTAANAGMPCISVSWGFKGREFLEKNGASTIIDSPDEIFDLL